MILTEKLLWTARRKYQFLFGCATLTSALSIFCLQADYFTRPHVPDFDFIRSASLAIRLHIAAALFALMLGSIQLAMPKGGMRHKIFGWFWIALMMFVAISSLFVTGVNNGYSPVHILTVLTIVGLPIGVLSARQRNWKRHAAVMRAVFAIGLVAGGIFNFMPGRLVWRVVFG